MLLIVPGTGVVGEGEQTGTLLFAPAPTMVGLAWVTLLLFAAPQLKIENVLNLNEGGIYRHRMVHRVVLRAHGLKILAMFQMPGLGSHGKGVCHSSQKVKPGWGDPRECSQTPLQQQSVSSQHSLSGPKPKLTQVKAVNKKEQKGITPIPFLNPNPVVHLVGHANGVPVVIVGCEVAALIDWGHRY